MAGPPPPATARWSLWSWTAATRSIGSTPARSSWAAPTKVRRACAGRRATAPSTAPISAISTATSSAPSASARPDRRGRRLKVRLIVNRGGGSFSEEQVGRLEALFADRGVEVDSRLVEPETLALAFAEAAEAGGLDAVVAAGGDGTISAAAAALAGSDRPLGVVPLGTLNHFARDAGLPADPGDAVAAIAGGATRLVDVAEVNGIVFVNNSALGLYPMMVRGREAQQRRFGRSKRLAMLIASLRALRHFSRRRLTIRAGGGQAPIETPLLFV